MDPKTLLPAIMLLLSPSEPVEAQAEDVTEFNQTVDQMGTLGELFFVKLTLDSTSVRVPRCAGKLIFGSFSTPGGVVLWNLLRDLKRNAIPPGRIDEITWNVDPDANPANSCTIIKVRTTQ